MRKYFSLVLLLITFSMVAIGQTTDREKMMMEREAQQRAEMATRNLDQKVKPYGKPMHMPKVIDRGGALNARGNSYVTVLVASPNAEGFNTHVLPIMEPFGAIDYTVTENLGELTVQEMLEYDVVFTFNVTKWEVGTGTTPEEWSDKLGAYINAGGYLVEALFMNGADAWGLGTGTYINENLSPFIKATKDYSGTNFVMGDVVVSDHPIMSGVNEVTTNYYVQDVKVREDATLLAKWGNTTTDPLIAVYDHIVALNAGPIFSSGQQQGPGLGEDGYKMLHNAFIWLYNNQADPDAPAAPFNLTAEAGDNGELNALVSWNNPNKTFGGDDLEELTSVTILVNGEDVGTIENPIIGEEETYAYQASEAGHHVFTVYGTNAFGDGIAASYTIWIGEDAPSAPQNVELVATANGGLITWDAPTTGFNGGYLNPANTVYTVIRMPDVVIAENIVETEYNDDFNPTIGNYQYKVIAGNGMGEGGTAQSNIAVLGAEGILFYENFDGVPVGTIPTGWTKEGFANAEWRVQNTTVAGGVAPEMNLYWDPQFNDLSRLVTNPFNLGNDELLRVKFKHYLGNFSTSDNTLAFQVSFDDGEWINLWHKEITGSFGEELELYIDDIPAGTTQMRLGWEFNGNVYQINYYNFDDVIVEPVVDNDLAAISIDGNLIPTAGVTSTYTVAIKNGGKLTQTNYSVKLMKEGGVELASADGVEIQFSEIKEFEFVWTPSAADVGSNTIYGEIIFGADEVPGNNTTTGHVVTVQPEGVAIVTIGEGTEYPPVRLPFDFYWKNSFAQTIYYADEINLENGAITSIAYSNSFTTTLTDKAIKVWVGETDLDNLDGGWIPLDELELVYDGTMDFPVGENSIVIPFNDPYIYGGGNLVVYTNRVWENAYAGSMDRFFGTNDPSSKRTRYMYADGTGPLDPANPGSGTVNDWHPNTMIFFNTSGLSELTGKVVNAETEEPIEGVLVETYKAKARTYTNNEGDFSFVLLADNYTLSFSKFGYESKTIADVEVEADGVTAIENVILNPIPTYTVSGLVKGNDGLSLQGATISLEGYGTYEVTTNNNGEFSISGVYQGNYSIAVSMEGYMPYSADEIEINTDLVLENIILDEIIIIPSGLAVDVFNHGDGNALFTWTAGEKLFRYDDGSVDGQLGFQNGTENNVMGAVYHHHAKLNTVSWFLTNEGGPHATVKVWILGLTQAGTPNASDVLFSQEGVANTNMEWNTLELPETVEAPNGFFIGVGTTGFIALATDTGTDTEWPFQPNANFGGNIVSGEFFSFDSQNFMVNALVRATGKDLGELRIDAEANSFPMVTDLLYTKNETSFMAYYPSSIPSIKEFTGYNVYLNDMNTPVATDVTATQYLFTNLDEGNFTAGVQAVHTTDSSPIITIDFFMDYGVSVKVNISTNSGDSPQGAQVTLVSDAHEYLGTADAQGEVEFPVVYKGTYNLTVSLEGHEVYEQQNISIQENKEFDVELLETIIDPFGLLVEQLNNNIDVKFSWNNFFGFTDDFESYEDFIIVGIGEYTLFDGDGSATYSFSGIDFPNSSYTGSYIIFNPSQTTPPIENESMIPHSGEKFIGCFAATNGPNNDWLITPQIAAMNGMKLSFWAKTYMDYGLEQFRVAVSTTDNSPDSFEFISDIIQAPLANWGKFEFDLSSYAGQDIYVAIVCVSDDVFVFMVDDLEVSVDSKVRDNVLGYTQTTFAHSNVKNTFKAFLGYKVYLDGQLVSGETPISVEEFNFTGLEMDETYMAGVRSVYTSGESDMVTVQFTTLGMYDVIGKVVDAGSEAALANVEVKLDSRSEATNVSGEFVFDNMLAGEYTLSITHEGYEPYTQEVNTDNATGKVYDLGTIKLIKSVGVMDETFATIASYPNPFDNYITISNAELVKRVVITNTLGQRVMDVELNGKDYINTQSLVQGVYLMLLEGENGNSTVRRMVKK